MKNTVHVRGRWPWMSLLICASWMGCGKPPEYEASTRGASQPISSSKDTNGKNTKDQPGIMVDDKMGSMTTSSNTDTLPTPTPSATPAATKLALRNVPNDKEKADMKALYEATNAQGGCVGCHGALATSAKKGRTATAIQNSSTIAPHRTPAAANKWPKDLADTNDDGTDTAQLNASALADLLKN